MLYVSQFYYWYFMQWEQMKIEAKKYFALKVVLELFKKLKHFFFVEKNISIVYWVSWNSPFSLHADKQFNYKFIKSDISFSIEKSDISVSLYK